MVPVFWLFGDMGSWTRQSSGHLQIPEVWRLRLRRFWLLPVVVATGEAKRSELGIIDHLD